MVAEGYEAKELPTKDGSNGPWCIVGDDLDELITEAFDVWFDDYQNRDNAVALIEKLKRECDSLANGLDQSIREIDRLNAEIGRLRLDREKGMP